MKSVKKEIKYQWSCSDGRVFNTEREAVYHEVAIALTNIMSKSKNPSACSLLETDAEQLAAFLLHNYPEISRVMAAVREEIEI